MTKPHVTGRRPRFAALRAAYDSYVLLTGAMKRKLGWWSVPLLHLLIVLALLLAFLTLVQPLAPFVYPLF